MTEHEIEKLKIKKEHIMMNFAYEKNGKVNIKNYLKKNKSQYSK